MSKFHHHFEIVKVEKFCILNEFPSQKVQIIMKKFAYKQGLLVKFTHFQDVFMHKGH